MDWAVKMCCWRAFSGVVCFVLTLGWVALLCCFDYGWGGRFGLA